MMRPFPELRAFALIASGLSEGLLKVGLEVGEVFAAEAESDVVGLDAGGDLLLGGELAVGGAGGWMARLLASPMLARWLKSLSELMTRLAPSKPAFTPKPRRPPYPPVRYLLAAAWYFEPGRPG